MKLKEWEDLATTEFAGKVVDRITWITKKDVEDLCWFSKAPVILFTDGSYIFASADDEGNDAGALFTSSKKIATIPVIPPDHE